MVAITVVLAGVIGVMVFGLADDLGGGTGPTTTADVVNTTEDSNTDPEANFEFQHAGGDTIPDGELIANAYDDGGSQLGSVEVPGELNSSSSLSATFDDSNTDLDAQGDVAAVELIHDPSGTTIAEYEK